MCVWVRVYARARVCVVSESLLILRSVRSDTVLLSKNRWVHMCKGCGGIVSVCVCVFKVSVRRRTLDDVSE